MRLFGIPTRVPSFNEITAASVLAVGLWLAACGLMFRMGQTPDAFSAGALLLIVEWACVAVAIGIRPDQGARHMVANIAVSALLVGVYAQVWGLFA